MGKNDQVRNKNGDLVRECRLRKITMTDDEKDLWFLFRNGQLRLGHAQSWKRHGPMQLQRAKRRLGKCCMCATSTETWKHVLRCRIRIEWTREMLQEAGIDGYNTIEALSRASTLEAKDMATWHVETM